MPPFTGGVEPPGTDLIDVEIEAPELCRRYIGAPITGVKVGPSPLWLRRRLFAAGVRPISNVVDITNYVALEYGQPLHAFDLAKIAGRRIVVRRARAGERLLCLDGETRSLTPDTLVIADAERPVALAGIIGGADSAVSGQTTDLLLEAANFDGVNIRSTSRTLRLRTESSSRFEKAISPETALAGARRAAGLLAELAEGRVHVGWADAYPRPQEPIRVRFRPEQVDAVLGAHVPLQEMEAILKRLEFQVRVQDDGEWDLLPPVFRLDVSIPEDVAEEVGRMYGYEHVPATLPGARRTSWRPAAPSQERQLDPLRSALAGPDFRCAARPAPGRQPGDAGDKPCLRRSGHTSDNASPVAASGCRPKPQLRQADGLRLRDRAGLPAPTGAARRPTGRAASAGRGARRPKWSRGWKGRRA